MISYCLVPPNAETPWAYAKDWKTAPIKDYDRIAKCMA